MTNNSLLELSTWYFKQCNGTWEHQNGIRIDTIDNPGWKLEIDINGTNLQCAADLIRDMEVDDSNWLSCTTSDGVFRGFCGALNLSELIDVFLEWNRQNSLDN